MSYMIFNGQRPAGNKKFSTYETARNKARQLVRRFFSSKNGFPISLFGYSIRKV